MGHGRCAARVDGRGRVQARGARADLPEVHLRRLRGAARAARRRSRTKGADPEDPDEYRAAEHLLGAARGALGAPASARRSSRPSASTVDDAMAAIERDNPPLKGVLPKDYARPALDKERLGELIDLIATIGLGDAENRSKDVLGRVYEYFLSQFASAEGKKGGQFYTAALRRPAAGRDARALQGPRLRPLLRLRRDVRAERGIHRGPRRPHRRHLDLRPGVELHHLAAGQDEPRHPRHRRPDRDHADTFHSDRTPTSRPTSSSPTRPSTISDWGGELLQRRRALEVRRPAARATPTSPGCSTSSTTWRPGGLAGFVLANGSHVLQPVGRGRDPPGHRRGRPGRLHGRPARPALLLHADPRLPVVPGPGQAATAASATAAARCSSSTPASSAPWSTAPTAS